MFYKTLTRPEVEPKTELGARLRSVRKALGDPHRAVLSVRLGVAKNSLAHYERGDRLPDAKVLAAYYLILGVNLHWLLSGQGDMFVREKAVQSSPQDEIDLQRLMTAIETIEEALHKYEWKMDPYKKAMLIKTAYVMLNDNQDRNNIINLLQLSYEAMP